MNNSYRNALWSNFLGKSPNWYKQMIIAFLALNPVLLVALGPVVTGWVLIGEFIFTLTLALRCYPLQPGGLLAIEGIALGLADSQSVFHEVEANLEVILLLVFMVAGVYFMKDLLLFLFTKILLNVRSKKTLAFLFTIVSAILSAFLDALTVTAVLISVGVGFYSVFHRVASGMSVNSKAHDHTSDHKVSEASEADLDQFRAFLRSLLMHGVVGTALGGACTMVGEPQNLLIATEVGWDFPTFFFMHAPITMPVMICGLLTCFLLERTGWFGYGALLPENVRHVLVDFEAGNMAAATSLSKMRIVVQAFVAIFLVFALAFHIAAVGLIGLLIIVLLTTFNGVTNEHDIGHAFQEALPFTALLVVFFAIVAVIHEQHLFAPVIEKVLTFSDELRPAMFFLANGTLSAISDNVFVATVYISEIDAALAKGEISRQEFERLAIAINTGTNLPSVATPNGQAAFLFLLTSALAPMIRLSYGRMVFMALPYTFVLTSVGFVAVVLYLR